MVTAVINNTIAIYDWLCTEFPFGYDWNKFNIVKFCVNQHQKRWQLC